jgi:hypothetical protein
LCATARGSWTGTRPRGARNPPVHGPEEHAARRPDSTKPRWSGGADLLVRRERPRGASALAGTPQGRSRERTQCDGVDLPGVAQEDSGRAPV